MISRDKRAESRCFAPAARRSQLSASDGLACTEKESTTPACRKWPANQLGDAAHLVQTWEATTGVPIDATLRGLLEGALRRVDPAPAARIHADPRGSVR